MSATPPRRSLSCYNTPTMTIPYKANPGVPGTILRFSTRRARSDEYAYRDLFFSAFALTNTSISVDVLGYENLPSVLILCNEDNAVTARRWLKQLGSGFADKQSDTKSSELIGDESVDEVYGTGSADTLDDTPAEEDPASKKGSAASSRYLSEDEFLSGITIDRKTGIHVYYSKSREGAPARMRLVQAAQKYFDIVLVEPGTMEFLDQESNVTVLEYLDAYREPASSVRHVPVRLYPELANLMRDNKRKGGAYSIKSDYGNMSLRMFTAEALLVCALGTVENNPWNSLLSAKLSFKEKMSLLSIRADESTEAGLFAGVLGGIVGAVGVFGGLGTGFFDPDSGIAFTQMFGAIFGTPAAFVGGHTALTCFSNKGRKVMRQYNERRVGSSDAPMHAVSAGNILLSEHPALIAAGVHFEGFNAIAQTSQSLGLGSTEDQHKAVQSKPKTAHTAGVGVKGRSENSSVETAPISRTSAAAMVPLSRNILMKRLNKLTEEWMTYELDPMKSLDYPLMLDSACPQTRSFLMAIQNAQSIVSELDSGEVSLAEFRDAVLYAEEAFVEAEGNAKKMRYAHLDSSQRKKIKDARPLVAMLDDEKVSPHEKVSAYRKAGDFLEGIIALPERPIMGLLESGK